MEAKKDPEAAAWCIVAGLFGPAYFGKWEGFIDELNDPRAGYIPINQDIVWTVFGVDNDD